METPKLNAVGKPYSPQYDPNYKVTRRTPDAARRIPQRIGPVKGWEYRNGKVAVKDVFVPKSWRALNEETVASLAASIQKIGLQHPITVTQRGESYTLIAGHHRLEAVKSLGDSYIPAIVTGLEGVEARLWTISENLHRADLTKLERDELVAEWLKLVEGQEVSGQVVQKPQGGRPEGGLSAASRELGVNRKDAERAVKVDSITPEAKVAACEAGLDDNRSALLQVAAEEPAKQIEKVAEIAEARKKPRAKVKAQLTDDEMPTEEGTEGSLRSLIYHGIVDGIGLILASPNGRTITDGFLREIFEKFLTKRREVFGSSGEPEHITDEQRIRELERLNIALQSENAELRKQLEVYRSPVRCEFVEDDGGRAAAGYEEAGGDCVARAIAIATGKSYAEVFEALKERHASYVKHLRHDHYERNRRVEAVDNGCGEKVYGPYLGFLGWEFTRLKERTYLRAGALPSGRLIVHVNHHLVALVDGVIHDTHDSGGAGKRPVSGYWSQAAACTEPVNDTSEPAEAAA